MSEHHGKSQTGSSAPSDAGIPPVIRDWGQQLAAAAGETWEDQDWPDPPSAPSIFDDEEDEAVAAALRADLAKLVGPDGKSRPDGTIAREDADITDAVRGIEASIAGWKLATANKAIAALGKLLDDTNKWVRKRTEMRKEVLAANARLETVKDIPLAVRQQLLEKPAVVLAAINEKGGLDWEVEADVVQFGKAVDAAVAMERQRAELRVAVQAAGERMAAERGLRDDERGPLLKQRDTVLATIDRDGGREEAGVDAEVAKFVKEVDSAIAQAKAGVFVGTGKGGVNAIKVAASNFQNDNAYNAAIEVLNDLSAKGWRFRDEKALTAYVSQQPKVKEAQEAAAAARERIAAERAAAERQQQEKQEARARTPAVFTFKRGDPLRNELVVREYDITQGAWQQLTTQSAEASAKGRNRKEDDFELVTQIDGMKISFHVHGPKYSKGAPTSGALMVDDHNPKNTQVPTAIVEAIVRLRKRPKAWDT